jgi:hypothetical protein
MGFLGRILNKIASSGSPSESSTSSEPVQSSIPAQSIQPHISTRHHEYHQSRFSRLINRPNTEKSNPSERIKGYSKQEWAESGYPSKTTELPTVQRTITVTSNVRNDDAELRPLNAAERTAWESQNKERRGRRRPQHEMSAITTPDSNEVLIIKGERDRVVHPSDSGVNEDYDRTRGVGRYDVHPHPTDLGAYLPTPSQVDHARSIYEGAKGFSVISPTKVYSASLPPPVYAPKYQTENSRDPLIDGGTGNALTYPNATKRKDLRQGHIAQRVGVLWDTAINQVAEKHPEFRGDPVYNEIKGRVAKYSGRGLPTAKRIEVDEDTISDLETEIAPEFKLSKKGVGNFTTKMSSYVSDAWLKSNRKQGITGLTHKQAEIVRALDEKEKQAYDKTREYIMARKVYSIGGELRSADFKKSDVKSGRPIEFHEVPEKARAVMDLRNEYRLTNIPHIDIRRRRERKLNRSTINKYDMPTTEIDQEYIDSVPMRERLSGRARVVGRTIHSSLFGGRSPLDEPEDIGSFGMNITTKPKKKKKRSGSDKKLDKKMDNILYGDHTKPKKKKRSGTIKKDGWDEVLK